MIITPMISEYHKTGVINKDLFSGFFQERIVFLFGEVTDEMSITIISQLLYLDSMNHEDITLYINSPGGSVSAGLAIYDTMNYIKSDVKTICIGMAASMASLLLAAGTKGKRSCLINSDVLIHQPLGGVSGQATDIEILSNRMMVIKKRVSSILAKCTGQTIETILKDTERDNYLTSQQAKDYGIVDEVIGEE